jgi:DNA-binding phage protein
MVKRLSRLYKDMIVTPYGRYTAEQLVETIKNNMLLLSTTLRNDEASSLYGRLAIIRKTKELARIALNLGIKSPEVSRTLRMLGIELIEHS